MTAVTGIGWRQPTAGDSGWRTGTPSVRWVDCPTCWGQGRILIPGHMPMLDWKTCHTCLGVGMTLRKGRP